MKMKCSCVHWECWRHWRKWFRAFVAAGYCVILLVLLPILIWDLYREHAEASFKAWFVAGIFVLLTIPIFLAGLVQHLLNYTQPYLQKHIIRILWMVPIYSIDSMMGLWFPQTAIYWNTVRECYESYVLYNFLCYLLNFLEAQYDLLQELTSRPPVRQPIPFCCCPPWPRGKVFIRRCKVGVLQYTIVRIAVTIAALITEICKVYDEGKFRLDRSYVYLTVTNGISQIIAIHSLIYFYLGTRHLLKPLKPVPKFLSIKAIIFFSFWQSIVIAILVRVGGLRSSWKQYDVEDVALGLQNLVICIEMLLFAIAHYFIFSHKPYVDPAAAQVPCITSCLWMLDVRDVYGDVKEHFVDPLPRPLMSTYNNIRRSSSARSSLSASPSSSASSLSLNHRQKDSELVPLLSERRSLTSEEDGVRHRVEIQDGGRAAEEEREEDRSEERETVL